MATKNLGLSRELIIHPGETLQEVLEDRNITVIDFANKTGVKQNDIEEILNGFKSISNNSAKQFEKILGIKKHFWVNLQKQYNEELLQISICYKIEEEEIEIFKKLKKTLQLYIENKFIKPANEKLMLLDLRKILNVPNLSNIPEKVYNSSYRTSNIKSVDVYVMYAWQKLCELIAEKQTINKPLNINLLKSYLKEIKSLMFVEDINDALKKLKIILNDCGIVFEVVKNVTGAPVQGLVEYKNGHMVLCMTIRNKYADIFWFTLFHEIGHIINDDIKDRFIDFNNMDPDSQIEIDANNFAKNILINPDDYKLFTKANNFDLNKIEEFAKTQEVPLYIVIGRLQKDEYISYNKYSYHKVQYDWAD